VRRRSAANPLICLVVDSPTGAVMSMKLSKSGDTNVRIERSQARVSAAYSNGQGRRPVGIPRHPRLPAGCGAGTQGETAVYR
jgi:hypothetical protein